MLTKKHPFAIATWLFICCMMIAFMVLVGGATRLTDSGLSMTEWKPILGVVPPITAEEWEVALEKYRSTVEYKTINRGMSIDAFKFIYYMEYSHRMLGRLTGLVYFLPFLFFLIKGSYRSVLTFRLILFLILGAGQGFMGWYMVQSGLADRPDVSQYRLTAHLTYAFSLFALLFWTGLSVLREAHPIEYRGSKTSGLRRWKKFSFIIVGLILLQIVAGGFVAGLEAGLIYNTYPLMGNKFVPDELWFNSPWYMNFFENHTMVQFVHRMLALVVSFAVVIFCVNGLLSVAVKPVRIAMTLLIVVLFVQFMLGVFTLLHQVPLVLGVLHQINALAVFAVSLYISHYFCAIMRTGRIRKR